MKLLFVVSSLDLTQPFSATPAWWQLLKGLYEVGIDVIATPYQGPAVESLWWRAAPNPAKWQGDLFKAMRDRGRQIANPHRVAARRHLDDSNHRRLKAVSSQESLFDRLVRRASNILIAPLWFRHLDRILTEEPDIDAVIVLTAPLNQLTGVPRELMARHHKPIFYYDGDVPASLPNMAGFATGFRIYQGADLSEYTAFISNSKGGTEPLKALGAREVYPLFYGADPVLFSRLPVPEQDIDVFFYGHGREYRSDWIDWMLTEPSQTMPDAHFAVRGTNLDPVGRTEALPYLSFSKLREYACRSKINLCITRAAHASVYASSSSRPFELASMGCCIVSNPYTGIEEWFEPEKEILIVHSGEEAIDRYRFLLTHDRERSAIGAAARERLVKSHTFRHRAEQLRDIIKLYL